MKKILLAVFVLPAVIACNLDGYSEYTLTSVSDFEFNVSAYTDSLFFTSQFNGGDYSRSMAFNNARENDDDIFTGGCVATMKRDSSIVLKPDNDYPQYTMFATSAAQGSSGCVVFYQNNDSSKMPEHDVIFTDCDYGTCTPSYFMINNTQQTVYDVLSEDSPSKYEPGDYLKLTVVGMKQNEYTGTPQTTGRVEFYLADWRNAKDEPDSVLTSWKTLSLSRLGSVDYIDFEIESNKTDILKTFCFDNLVTSIYLKFNY